MCPLNFVVPPRWRSEPHNKTCQAGELVSFDCDAFGVPTPQIKWFRLQEEERTEIVRLLFLSFCKCLGLTE